MRWLNYEKVTVHCLHYESRDLLSHKIELRSANLRSPRRDYSSSMLRCEIWWSSRNDGRAITRPSSSTGKTNTPRHKQSLTKHLPYTNADINECEIPSLAALCSDNSECCNLPGHFVCKCKPGYQQAPGALAGPQTANATVSCSGELIRDCATSTRELFYLLDAYAHEARWCSN